MTTRLLLSFSFDWALALLLHCRHCVAIPFQQPAPFTPFSLCTHQVCGYRRGPDTASLYLLDNLLDLQISWCSHQSAVFNVKAQTNTHTWLTPLALPSNGL